MHPEPAITLIPRLLPSSIPDLHPHRHALSGSIKGENGYKEGGHRLEKGRRGLGSTEKQGRPPVSVKRRRKPRGKKRKRNKKREKGGGKRIVLDILGIMGGDQFHLKMGGRPEAMRS